MKKILWLASWYPNRLEPLTGDFIERHAKAVSLLNSVFVLHVLKDHLNITPGKVFTEKRTYNERCSATIIYYKTPFKKIKWLNTVLAGSQFLKHFIRGVKQHIADNGRPDMIHVHVAIRAGLVALYL